MNSISGSYFINIFFNRFSDHKNFLSEIRSMDAAAGTGDHTLTDLSHFGHIFMSKVLSHI